MVRHRMYLTKEYQIWRRIKTACYNPRNRTYKTYGARGVRMDERWKEDFEEFLADMGYMPEEATGIELIDLNGDYTKQNCRWVNELTRRSVVNMPNQKRKGYQKKYKKPVRLLLIMEEEYVNFLKRQAIEKSREEGELIPVTTLIKRILEENAPPPTQLSFLPNQRK